MKKVTLLIPVYNEEAMLPTLYQRLIELINRNGTYAWEILFINDGSSDRTLDVIRQLRQTDGTTQAKCIELALEEAGFDKEKDNLYINAHGTGTKLNDKVFAILQGSV